MQRLCAQDQGFDFGIDVAGESVGGLSLAGDFFARRRYPFHDLLLHGQRGTGMGKFAISSRPIFHMPTAVLALD